MPIRALTSLVRSSRTSTRATFRIRFRLLPTRVRPTRTTYLHSTSSRLLRLTATTQVTRQIPPPRPTTLRRSPEPTSRLTSIPSKRQATPWSRNTASAITLTYSSRTAFTPSLLRASLPAVTPMVRCSAQECTSSLTAEITTRRKMQPRNPPTARLNCGRSTWITGTPSPPAVLATSSV